MKNFQHETLWCRRIIVLCVNPSLPRYSQARPHVLVLRVLVEPAWTTALSAVMVVTADHYFESVGARCVWTFRTSLLRFFVAVFSEVHVKDHAHCSTKLAITTIQDGLQTLLTSANNSMLIVGPCIHVFTSGLSAAVVLQWSFQSKTIIRLHYIRTKLSDALLTEFGNFWLELEKAGSSSDPVRRQEPGPAVRSKNEDQTGGPEPFRTGSHSFSETHAVYQITK